MAARRRRRNDVRRGRRHGPCSRRAHHETPARSPSPGPSAPDGAPCGPRRHASAVPPGTATDRRDPRRRRLSVQPRCRRTGRRRCSRRSAPCPVTGRRSRRERRRARLSPTRALAAARTRDPGAVLLGADLGDPLVVGRTVASEHQSVGPGVRAVQQPEAIGRRFDLDHRPDRPVDDGERAENSITSGSVLCNSSPVRRPSRPTSKFRSASSSGTSYGGPSGRPSSRSRSSRTIHNPARPAYTLNRVTPMTWSWYHSIAARWSFG